MKEQEIKQQTTEIIKQAIRKGSITLTASVMECIPELISCVKIDRNYILHCVENELEKKPINPFNALLGLFGLRIVRTKNAVKGIREEFKKDTAVESTGHGKLSSFLIIDSEEMKAAVETVANALGTFEIEQKQAQQSMQSQNNLLHSELNKVNSERTQINTDYQSQRNAIAERVQYMLSLQGEQDSSPMTEQLTELLIDLEMRAYWNSENTAWSEPEMFTVLKCDTTGKHRTKPCLVCDNSIYLKGVKFVAINENE